MFSLGRIPPDGIRVSYSVAPGDVFAHFAGSSLSHPGCSDSKRPSAEIRSTTGWLDYWQYLLCSLVHSLKSFASSGCCYWMSQWFHLLSGDGPGSGERAAGLSVSVIYTIASFCCQCFESAQKHVDQYQEEEAKDSQGQAFPLHLEICHD